MSLLANGQRLAASGCGEAATIAAVSSPPGRSARGLLRLSGPGSFAALDALLAQPFSAAPHHLTPVRLADPPLPALAVRSAGPRSYTGEDSAELQVPGHPALLERLLAQLTDQPGVRLAEPGEFTFRAYLNGKLDLTAAEGVAATIAAVSDGQLAAAGHLANGELAAFARTHVDHIGRLLALTEAGIDFVDQEDVVPITPADLAAGIAQATAALADLRRRSRSWGAVEALPRVVLAGPPSAGKSTLFNALLGRERAVVDAAAGTTRDALEEPLTLTTPGGQAEVMLVDLAGLDATSAPIDALDRAARRAAHDQLSRADLLLALDDTHHPDTERAACLRVHAKCDTQPAPAGALAVSAHTGVGIPELRRAIAQRLARRAVSVAADTLALQPRHTAALHAAADALAHAATHVAPAAHQLHEIELVADALRTALDALAGLGGELTPDDVIGRVFATFCVGK